MTTTTNFIPLVPVEEIFDLISYIQSYQGQTKIQRLIFIAEQSPRLKAMADKLLVNELKSGYNTDLYMKLCQESHFNDSALGHIDADWVQSVSSLVQSKQNSLSSELLAAKNSLIKESFRIASNELGHLCYQMGHLDEALKYYMRSQDGCTLPRHFHEMSLHVAQVSIDLNNWQNASVYCNNINSTEGASTLVKSKLAALQGLVHLHTGTFKHAALQFLAAGTELGNSLSSTISKEDVATYTALCALATFDRAELKAHFVDNRSFSQDFLSAAPLSRELINNFYEGNYAAFSVNLKDINRRMLLDLHLWRHAPKLHELISEKIVIQYFAPYAVVNLLRMSASVDMEMDRLEKMLVKLISAGKLPARIDSREQTMYRHTVDPKTVLLRNAVELSQVHVQDMKRNILRLSILKHNFHVSEAEQFRELDQNTDASTNKDFPGFRASGGDRERSAMGSGRAGGRVDGGVGGSSRTSKRKVARAGGVAGLGEGGPGERRMGSNSNSREVGREGGSSAISRSRGNRRAMTAGTTTEGVGEGSGPRADIDVGASDNELDEDDDNGNDEGNGEMELSQSECR